MSHRPLLININELQPSQLYISRKKLHAVNSWIIPNPDSYDPIPVRQLDGKLVITDGHTRLYALSGLGHNTVRIVHDCDDLDWEAYRICVSWCLESGITSIDKLMGRVLEHNEYIELWINRCQVMQKELDSRFLPERA